MQFLNRVCYYNIEVMKLHFCYFLKTWENKQDVSCDQEEYYGISLDCIEDLNWVKRSSIRIWQNYGVEIYQLHFQWNREYFVYST